MLQITHFCCVKFLAWKSVSVNFLTNIMSVVSVPQFPNQEAISLLASPSLNKELEVRILTGAIGGRDEPAFRAKWPYKQQKGLDQYCSKVGTGLANVYQRISHLCLLSYYVQGKERPCFQAWIAPLAPLGWIEVPRSLVTWEYWTWGRPGWQSCLKNNISHQEKEPSEMEVALPPKLL